MLGSSWACEPQLLKPVCRERVNHEARGGEPAVRGPHSLQLERGPRSNKDSAQPKK